jgi:hypothetical protein
MLLFACQSDGENDSHESASVLMLQVDYTTNVFESGVELSFPVPAQTFTVGIDYKDPGDFGSIKIYYSEINQLLFHGGIHWMGCGEIIYPENWLPANGFTRVLTADYQFPENGFENIFIFGSEDDFNYDAVWKSVQGIVKVREYLSCNPEQKVKLFLYMPSVGAGDPKDWKWILFLKK